MPTKLAFEIKPQSGPAGKFFIVSVKSEDRDGAILPRSTGTVTLSAGNEETPPLTFTAPLVDGTATFHAEV